MKKIFFLAASALMSLSMMAATVTINPAWEGNYRTNNAEPTGWTKVTVSDAQFEVFNGSRFFAVQTWQIANISQVESLEFVYPRVSGQTNNGDVSIWAFPYNSMVTSTANYSTEGVAFLSDVAAVLGVYPGNEIDSAHIYLATSVSQDTLGMHRRVITMGAAEIAALKAAGTIDNDYLTVNVLLNTFRATNNYKYYHVGTDAIPASFCNVTYAGEVETPAILNNNTKEGYSDLHAAVAEATAGDVLVLNEPVTLDSTITITKALTIQGASDTIRLICNVPADKIMILANDNMADYEVQLKNLIIDGQNTERGVQTLDANGKAKLVFDGVRVVNTLYSVATADVKNAGGNVTLKGVNAFAQGIYLNKNKRIDAQYATHTEENPIRIVLASDYVEEYAIVLKCNNTALFTAVDANGEYTWELYVESGKNELKGRKELISALEQNEAIEAKAVKFIENGRLFIRRGNSIYTVSGQLK